MKRASGIVSLLCFCLLSHGQLSRVEKQQIITDFNKQLQIKYVFPEMSKQLGDRLLENLDNANYDTITSKGSLAFQLTRDIQKISKDLHLKLNYDVVAPKKADAPAQQKSAGNGFQKLLTDNNYGIKSKKILTGNIGYLEIPLFGPINACADTIVAAMNYIAATDALIIDLRGCRGALDENTLLFFMSYFFDEPKYISDFYEHEQKTTRQNWTYAWVPGKRYLGKSVYLLTSGRTFSGGEAFAYDLQQIKRAMVIGETTRGGAHPTELVRINPDFTAAIPYARPINTISKTNWEHTGVKPDSIVKSNRALYAAHVKAVETLIAKNTGIEKDALVIDLDNIRAYAPQFRIVKFELKGYSNAKEVAVAGSFNSYARNTFLLKKVNDKWMGEAEVEPGEITYSFIVDGLWIRDPENPETKQVDEHLNSFKIIR